MCGMYVELIQIIVRGEDNELSIVPVRKTIFTPTQLLKLHTCRGIGHQQSDD